MTPVGMLLAWRTAETPANVKTHYYYLLMLYKLGFMAVSTGYRLVKMPNAQLNAKNLGQNFPSWIHETSAQGWCTGKTQKDGMRRKAGGGIRMGNPCKSMADSCQCMAKPLQYCKVISFQLIKINEKKSWAKIGSTNKV